MNWRNHTRMFTPERIGLIALCTVFGVLLIALLLSQRDCRGADTRAAAIVVIDSIARQDSAIAVPPRNTPKDKTEKARRHGSKPLSRSHLDEDIAR